MSVFVSIEPEAEADVEDAFDWHEEQAVGLGGEFLRAVDACLGRIARHPLLYRTVHRKLRRAFVRRFPYAVFFLLDGERIVVLAVCHVRRDPKVWQQRI